jgi:bifunctional oligoribonuclease and PAP phosphatase NrnA
MLPNKEPLTQIASELLKAKSVAICGHSHPDGDAIGSTLAIYLLCEALDIEATPLIADDSIIPSRYDFMYGHDFLMPAARYNKRPQLFFSVDTATESRHGLANNARKNAKRKVGIDHHDDDHSFLQTYFVDPSAAACGMIAWDFVKIAFDMADQDPKFENVAAQREEYMPDIALACYTALFTDCGGFCYQNTDVAAFEYASDMLKYGVDPSLVARKITQSMSIEESKLRTRIASRIEFVGDGDIALSYVTHKDFDECNLGFDEAEDLVSVLRVLDGIEAALLLRESTDGAGIAIRGSMRAKDKWDVARFARQHNGGGHVAAAGLTLRNVKMEEALEAMRTALDAYAKEERARLEEAE